MQREEKNSHEKNVDTVFFDKGLALNMITFLDGTELYAYKLIAHAANSLIIQSLRSSNVLKETVNPLIKQRISAERDRFVQIGEGYVDIYTDDFNLPAVDDLIEAKSNVSVCVTIRKLKWGICLLTFNTLLIAGGGGIIYMGTSDSISGKIICGVVGGLISTAGVAMCVIMAPKMYKLSKVYNSVSNLVGNFHSLLGGRMSTSLTQQLLLKNSQEEKRVQRANSKGDAISTVPTSTFHL